MAKMNFTDQATALRFREWTRKMIRTEIEKELPTDRYGTVTSIDWPNFKCTVLLNGASTEVIVRFARNQQPTHVGQLVRVAGRRHDRYVGALGSNPDWIPLTGLYANGWADYGGGGSYETPGYRRDPTGRIHLRGLIASGTTTVTAFTLPVDFRPPLHLIFTSICSGDTICRIDVENDGDVKVKSNASNTWVSLAGISFDTIAS